MQPIGYKNHARVFSSVVDASLKIACAADGVREGPIFCYYTDIYCYKGVCGSSVHNSKICATLHVLYLTNLFLMIFNYQYNRSTELL